MNAPVAEDSAGFNLSRWTVQHQALVVFLVVLVTLFGVISYRHLAQSEDPPFTWKVMVMRTLWPGASAEQVRNEITDRLARKLQESPELDYLQSYSRPGESTLFFVMKDSEPSTKVPETWYQIRKKIGDIALTLPPGTLGPFFNDEFGDVYIAIYGLEGDGYSPAQMHDYAERLRTNLLLVKGIAKVDLLSDQAQHVYVEISNAQLAKLGLTPQQIAAAVQAQNSVSGAGELQTQDDRVFVRPSGQLHDPEQLRNVLIRAGNHLVRLGDIATIQRGYDDPPQTLMRVDQQPVLGIGITMSPHGDVVALGKSLDKAAAKLQSQLPAGLKLVRVASMPQAVTHSVDDFIEAVSEAVGIVLLVSLISLGLRTGMVVVISIPVVLAATALTMYVFDIGLHKISLGTLILALGLLVDDAIIAVEAMAVKLEQGWDRLRAAAFSYTSTAFPMLTGTLVTVAGFVPIALAQSSVGEYTRSIFQVSVIALLISWLAAVTLIPLLGYHMLREHPQDSAAHIDPEAVYSTPFYLRLRTWISWCVDHRGVVLLVTLGLFVIALAGFSKVPQQFFPGSDRPELLVDLRLPEGATIDASLREARKLESLLVGRQEIDHYVDYVGVGSPRFYLPLDQQLQSPNLTQFVITARNVKAREQLAGKLAELLPQKFPEVRTRITRLENGPPAGYPVQMRVKGPDLSVVRSTAEQVATIMRADAQTANVQFNWDEPSQRSVHFQVDQERARQLNVSSADIANFLQMTLTGYTISQYRERDQLINIDLRAPRSDRTDPTALEHLALPSPTGTAVPLSALGHFTYGLESAVIWERDRQPTITVQSDVVSGAQGVDVTRKLEKKLEGLIKSLPEGYTITAGGPIEESAKGQSSIVAQLPILAIAVLVLLMVQLQSFGRVMMVVLTAPLGLIGVVGALLLAHKAFGFVAMLGTIAMFGIIMRNSVILVDQIERDIHSGHARFDAVVGATVRRFRPIVLTAAAAVLALIPLVRSNFFGPMATALMGGITVATLLTLFYLPAMYAWGFRIHRGEA